MRGCFTFGRINSLTSYDKSLHILLSKTRHCDPFALLFLLICICFSYPRTAEMICSSVLPLLPLPHPVRLHTKSTIFLMPLNWLRNYIIQISLERCLTWKSEIMVLANHCCSGSLLPWEQQCGNQNAWPYFLGCSFGKEIPSCQRFLSKAGSYLQFD